MVRSRTTVATFVVLGVGAVTLGVLFVAKAGWWSLAPIAFVLGWLNLPGACAQNSITAIVPAVTERSRQSNLLFAESLLAYTVFGLAASAAVGGGLSWLGTSLHADHTTTYFVVVLVAISAYVAVREGFDVGLPLLEPRRKSNRNWSKLGQPAAAAMWGIDVGMFFTTWMTYASAWWLVAIAVFAGETTLAMTFFGAYWIGRACLLAAGVWTVPNAKVTPWLPEAWAPFDRPYAIIDAVVVIIGTTIVLA